MTKNPTELSRHQSGLTSAYLAAALYPATHYPTEGGPAEAARAEDDPALEESRELYVRLTFGG